MPFRSEFLPARAGQGALAVRTVRRIRCRWGPLMLAALRNPVKKRLPFSVVANKAKTWKSNASHVRNVLVNLSGRGQLDLSEFNLTDRVVSVLYRSSREAPLV
jgi:hypothetical protein